MEPIQLHPLIHSAAMVPEMYCYEDQFSDLINLLRNMLFPQNDKISRVIQPKLLPSSEENQSTYGRNWMLEVNNFTSAAAVRAELGCFSLYTYMITRAAAYWLKVTQMEASRLPKICLDEQQILNFQRYSWLTRLLEILNRYGLGFPLCDTLEKVEQRIKDVHGQIDTATLTTNGSLGLLTVAKTTFTLEKYLYLEMPSLERELFAKFRFELLDTNVKFGHYRKIPYNDRTCVCRANAIEDTLHIIFDCSLYGEFDGISNPYDIDELFSFPSNLYTEQFLGRIVDYCVPIFASGSAVLKGSQNQIPPEDTMSQSRASSYKTRPEVSNSSSHWPVMHLPLPVQRLKQQKHEQPLLNKKWK
ncbi:hypothetical protein E2320_004716 [Naja naja]|nr:hypothetical protein E2320_004716 [Naja naja]